MDGARERGEGGSGRRREGATERGRGTGRSVGRRVLMMKLANIQTVHIAQNYPQRGPCP